MFIHSCGVAYNSPDWSAYLNLSKFLWTLFSGFLSYQGFSGSKVLSVSPSSRRSFDSEEEESGGWKEEWSRLAEAEEMIKSVMAGSERSTDRKQYFFITLSWSCAARGRDQREAPCFHWLLRTLNQLCHLICIYLFDTVLNFLSLVNQIIYL